MSNILFYSIFPNVSLKKNSAQLEKKEKTHIMYP